MLAQLHVVCTHITTSRIVNKRHKTLSKRSTFWFSYRLVLKKRLVWVVIILWRRICCLRWWVSCMLRWRVSLWLRIGWWLRVVKLVTSLEKRQYNELSQHMSLYDIVNLVHFLHSMCVSPIDANLRRSRRLFAVVYSTVSNNS